MFYGNPPHAQGLYDRTIITCPTCGWTSKELTRDELSALSCPLWCRNEFCGGKATLFVTFAPHQRETYHEIGL